MVVNWWIVLFFPVILVGGLFVTSTLFYFFYWLIRLKRLPPALYIPKKRSLFLRLFNDFPKQMWLDSWNRNPRQYPDFGFILICGEQGSGKTITLAYTLREQKRIYPDIKIDTNFGYADENAPITHWRDIVENENGELGQIDVLDEVHQWFSSLASKDFPPEMLSAISYQRKHKKRIIGTAQIFGRVSKPIREQCSEVWEPITIFGCLTIVFVYKPRIDDDGLQKKRRLIRMFCFVQSADLRASFDTWAQAKKMAQEGTERPSWLDEKESGVVTDGKGKKR